MSSFVHLHCHTEFSLLDGAIRINDLAQKAKDFGMPAAAITDHGNMHGAANFYIACKNVGIEPIIGCEVYVTNDHTDTKSELAKVRHHLILLAKNFDGYQNLLQLVSKSAINGYYYKPRVDKNLLKEHNNGLIALSACLAGEIPRTLLGGNKCIQGGGNFSDAIRIAKEYREIYTGNFYLEVQSNTLPEQDLLNQKIYELAAETKLPLVATNDCHYLEAGDVEAHDILLCVQQQKLESDPHRWRFDATDLYYKSPDEMEQAFLDYPEAISNTLRIADECSGLKIQMKAPPYHFPEYPVPEGMTLEDEFRSLALKGLDERFEKHLAIHTIDKKMYLERLEMELDIICGMEFPGYFLIVQDFINWAKNEGIPVGPGRGSAAGSIVAWALKITNLDPIPYKLFFERFLNVERISMPDIDVDFCEDRRLDVLKYVTKKYGKDKVAQIATFGKMKAKAVVRDVGRAIGFTFADTSRICKMLGSELDMTLRKALGLDLKFKREKIEQESDGAKKEKMEKNLEKEIKEINQELQAEYNEKPQIKRLLDICLRLEGLSRHASTHAAGVVVSDIPMDNYLPLFKGKKDELVTQFDMKIVEKIGLVKFDFLGLRTITLIDKALGNIKQQNKEVPDLDNLFFDDSAVFELYTRGDTDGIFQVESPGMRKYLRMLKPNCFEDIIAMLALYRPGPLSSGMVDEFCKRKHGEVDVVYPLEELEECLQDTYGVIVYQEQVMQIAQIVAQYTLGEADLLRRAMGKKMPEEMAQQRGIFLDGAAKSSVSEAIANEIFDLMEKFAEYGFNKAHSAAYAVISYHTAYLKHYFPVEFMAALLSSEIGNQDKILKYMAVCRDMGIEVKVPDVQKSRREFTPHEDSIIYGLGGVKNVGDEAINEIVSAREKDGEFLSFFDLCQRVSLRKMSKRVLESLIKCGALDCFGVSRVALLASMDTVVARVAKKQKEKDSKQVSMLSLIPQETVICGGIGFDFSGSTLPEWDDGQKLEFEKDALGFYLTSHPLQSFRTDLIRLGITTIEELCETKNGSSVEIAVLVTEIKEVTTKNNDKMAFLQVEDLTGHAEVIVFPKYYNGNDSEKKDESNNIISIRKILEGENRLFLLRGVVDNNQNDEDSYDEENPISLEVKVLLRDPTQKNTKYNQKSSPVDVGKTMVPLLEACQTCTKPIPLYFPSNTTDSKQLQAILGKHKGHSPVQIETVLGDIACELEFDEKWFVKSSPEFYHDYQEWLSSQDIK